MPGRRRCSYIASKYGRTVCCVADVKFGRGERITMNAIICAGDANVSRRHLRNAVVFQWKLLRNSGLCFDSMFLCRATEQSSFLKR